MTQQEKRVRYLREPEVYDMTKLSKSTRWRLERDGKFPKKRKLSAGVVAWLESEVIDWIISRETVNNFN